MLFARVVDVYYSRMIYPSKKYDTTLYCRESSCIDCYMLWINDLLTGKSCILVVCITSVYYSCILLKNCYAATAAILLQRRSHYTVTKQQLPAYILLRDVQFLFWECSVCSVCSVVLVWFLLLVFSVCLVCFIYDSPVKTPLFSKVENNARKFDCRMSILSFLRSLFLV